MPENNKKGEMVTIKGENGEDYVEGPFLGKKKVSGGGGH